MKLRIVKEDDFGERERRAILLAKDILWKNYEAFQNGGEERIMEEFEVPHDNLRLFRLKFRPDPIMIEKDTGDLVGGIGHGVTYIVDSKRGHGYSKYFHLTFDGRVNPFLRPSHYSPGGYASRAAAHREAVREAINRGQAVSMANLERYAEDIPVAKEVVTALMPNKIKLAT